MNGNAFLIDSDVYFEIEEVEYIKEYIDDHDEVMKAIIKKVVRGSGIRYYIWKKIALPGDAGLWIVLFLSLF